MASVAGTTSATGSSTGSATVALAGDTMLGRLVAERIRDDGPHSVVAPEVRAVVADADLVVLNLECCVSDRGTPWSAPGKPFFFRAPPEAAETLAWLGVRCVTLANNHALDFGAEALLDTRRHLAEAGISCVGAGADLDEARTPVVLAAGDLALAVIGVTDHPADFAAGPDRPGVAYADLAMGVPSWLTTLVGDLRGRVDSLLVTPHWGPNMRAEPRAYVRAAARALRTSGASMVGGHSAHVFHGMGDQVAYDLGDLVDDYRVDPVLHNDLGIVVLVTVDRHGPRSARVVPLALDCCRTRLARGPEYAWVARRFVAACAELDPDLAVRDEGDHLRVNWVPGAG